MSGPWIVFAVRQFPEEEQKPSADVDVGKLPEEAVKPMARWVDEERNVSRVGSTVGFGSTESTNPRRQPMGRRSATFRPGGTSDGAAEEA